jgi:uncharacterized protein (DUF433 family)
MSEEKYQRIELSEHIVADQRICHGVPTFKGTRKMVPLLLLRLTERGKTLEELAASAELPVEAVEDAIQLAAAAVRDYLRLPDPHPEEIEVEDQEETPILVGGHR